MTKHLTTLWILFSLAVAVATSTAAAPSVSPEPGLAVQGIITSVHDGDTVTVEITTRVNVRLLDC